MQPRRLDVLIACFSYGGNGGIASEHPDVRNWLLSVTPQMRKDPRVGRIRLFDIADTPISTSRNKAVVEARSGGYDLLLMIDSDMRPDMRLEQDPQAEPFWDVAFGAIHEHYDRGPLVIGSPYAGPPPTENIYVFHWVNLQSNHADDADMQLRQYTRHEACELAGIQPCAALPTGLILFDMRAFELTEPRKPGEKPWFYYEYTDLYESEKASTEDVTSTRDISLAGVVKLGYNPVHCAWSSWAGHWKPKCVGKPQLLSADLVAHSLRRAALERLPSDQRRSYVETPIAAEVDWSQVTRLDLDNGHREGGSCCGACRERSADPS
jgi:hypothetical protein